MGEACPSAKFLAQQSALIRRICSIVEQDVSRSRGEATMTARHRAREITTPHAPSGEELRDRWQRPTRAAAHGRDRTVGDTLVQATSNILHAGAGKAGGAGAPLIEKVRFAADSLVEGKGFDLSVPEGPRRWHGRRLCHSNPRGAGSAATGLSRPRLRRRRPTLCSAAERKPATAGAAICRRAAALRAAFRRPSVARRMRGPSPPAPGHPSRRRRASLSSPHWRA
jgi:hypothetical protein